MATREQLSGTSGLRGHKDGTHVSQQSVKPFGLLPPPQCPSDPADFSKRVLTDIFPGERQRC